MLVVRTTYMDGIRKATSQGTFPRQLSFERKYRLNVGQTFVGAHRWIHPITGKPGIVLCFDTPSGGMINVYFGIAGW